MKQNFKARGNYYMYKLIKSQIWKTCSLFCHFIFLLVAFSILLVKIYATSKKLLVAKKLWVDPWVRCTLPPARYWKDILVSQKQKIYKNCEIRTNKTHHNSLPLSYGSCRQRNIVTDLVRATQLAHFSKIVRYMYLMGLLCCTTVMESLTSNLQLGAAYPT